MKKILFLSDFHCGNIAGIAPPGYRCDAVRSIQEIFYDWFIKNLRANGPYDGLFVMGDMVDGEGKKGTLDTFETNISRQQEAAAAVIREAGVPPAYIWMVRGTPFHTNGVLEYEDRVAELIGCDIKNVQKRTIEGWNVHGKHVGGRSDIPYGQGTPLLKELDRLESEAFRESKEAPDVIERGHVHYDMQVRKHRRQALNCPCLELPLDGANSRRYSSWEYDVGFHVGYFEEDRLPFIDPIIMPLKLIKDEGYQCVKW